MSNFTGVTFAQQKVLPSDDAIIRRAILPDSILYGCDLSYSGSTLTMASGQLLICGRQIRHPSSQNWAVVDATSGYARLLLTVDLTRSSTKESFDQVIDTVEYASALDGFAELEQANINVSGSRYQVVVCVVSLGAGGITGIVSRLGNAATHQLLTATIPTTWSQAGNVYTLTLPVAGILATDTPHITPVLSSDYATRQAQKEAFGIIASGRAETGDGNITFTCDDEKPSVEIPIQIEVNR